MDPFGVMPGIWMVGGPLLMIAVLVAIVVLVVFLVRWLSGNSPARQSGHRPHSRRDSLEILRERFARGEIDKAEFEERRRLLEE